MAKFSINLQKGVIEKEEAPDMIIGIDLGTTNSLVACMQDGKPVAIRDASGRNSLLPSVLYFDPGGSLIVGEQAKEHLVTDPARTVFSVKRLMGKSYQDVRHMHHFFSYRILDKEDESLIRIEIDGRHYTPIELSAQILKALKQRVEKVLGREVSKAVITVPAYFNDAQRQATRDAGKLAGLEVLRILNEPTAASLAYGIGMDRSKTETIAVYDLGGGTFDISILLLEQGVFDVLSTNGDTFLGGDDIDRLILNYWNQEGQLDPVRLETDKSYQQQARLLAEDAKKKLSVQESYSASLDERSVSLRRGKLEELLRPLVEKTLDCCRKALQDAGKSTDAIDQVVMVGGSTRIPAIRQAVSAFFGKPLHTELDPDEVVALGAAIQADILAGNNTDFLLLDVTPLSLGIETLGGLMDTIVARNTKVPVAAARQYTTSVDGQTKLKISVYQGERELVQHNRKLGEFILKGIPPMPAGLPKIEIRFLINADGILVVRARELRSGVEQEIEIRSQYGLSQEELAGILKDSILHVHEDMQVRSLQEAINEAGTVLLATRKFITQHHSWLSQEELDTLERSIREIETSISAQDKDAILSRLDALNAYAAPLAHKAMDLAIQESLKGTQV